MRAKSSTVLTSALAFALLTGASAYAAEQGFDVDAKTAHTESDRNGDGNVDHREFQIRLVEVFFFADADRDGYLSADEWDTTGVREVEIADDDGDGRISMQEFIDEGFDRFRAADTDGNELLSLEEVEVAYASR